MSLKKISLFCILFFCYAGLSAQKENRFVAPDRYFGGIPLNSGFEAWFDYVNAHPFMGIDSIIKRVQRFPKDHFLPVDSMVTEICYSSYKPGIKSYFPFPDSLPVKMRFLRTFYYKNGRQNEELESNSQIITEAALGNNRAAKKDAKLLSRAVKKRFTESYRAEFRKKKKVLEVPFILVQWEHNKKLKNYIVTLSYFSPIAR